MIGFVVGTTLLAGHTKSVSVCGLNSAAVTQPGFARGSSPAGFLSYLVALWVGSATLVASLLLVGDFVIQVVNWPIEWRQLIVAIIVGLFGLIELAHGPRALPHIGWAVPRRWADLPVAGRPLFGLIRGVAIFNHSPFASFHAWLVGMVLLADIVPLFVTATLLALGLVVHSLVYSGFSLRLHSHAPDRFASWSATVLRSTRLVARLDAITLLLSAVALGTTALAGLS